MMINDLKEFTKRNDYCFSSHSSDPHTQFEQLKKVKKIHISPQDHFAGDIANENLKLKDLDEKSILQM